VGSALLDAVVDRLPDEVAVVSLDVVASNDLARGFYEDRGFRPVADGTYEVDDVAYPTERYARTLD
jgi:ribosomal protein S18 acetylase RimI-like enzyme